MRHHKWSRVTLIAAAMTLGASLLSVVQPSVDAPPVEAAGPCDAGGLANPGFEASAIGSDPLCWTVSQRNDRVRVVGEEGPSFSAVYAQKNITVTPPRGSKMLALGNPKQQGESQAKNPDTVTQTFTATSSSFELQLRLFSWEPDGNDLLKVSINNGATTRFPLLPPDIKPYMFGGCTGGTCAYTFDTGGRNDKRLLGEKSSWFNAAFSGLQEGVEYTVEITIGGTKRTSFATWGYVDDVNSPPVARFDIDRADDCSFAPVGKLYEGQPIPLTDCSYDPDGDIVSQQWTVDYPVAEGDEDPGDNSATDSRQSGFIIPTDQGAPTVTLTVTDNDGLTDTVTVGPDSECSPGVAGGSAGDGTCLPRIDVLDAPPLVDAVDVQAVAGSDVELVARFSDAGVRDSHTVTVGPSPDSVARPHGARTSTTSHVSRRMASPLSRAESCSPKPCPELAPELGDEPSRSDSDHRDGRRHRCDDDRRCHRHGNRGQTDTVRGRIPEAGRPRDPLRRLDRSPR